MSRSDSLRSPLRDQVPCPVRAAIGITLGLAISIAVTRAILWLTAARLPAEIREDVGVAMVLLTGVIFVAVLGVMGSIIQRTARLRDFFCWCSDAPE